MTTTQSAIKELADAPNYRPIGRASLQRCDTCAFWMERGPNDKKCDKHDFAPKANYVCDDWRPDVEKLQAARTAVKQILAQDDSLIESAKHLLGKHDQREHMGKKRKPGQQSAVEDEQQQASSGSRDRKSPRGQQSSKEAGSVPTAVPAHGPGGLLSAPGLGGRKKKKDEEETPLERAKHLQGKHDQSAHGRFGSTSELVDSLLKMPVQSRIAAMRELSPKQRDEVHAEMGRRSGIVSTPQKPLKVTIRREPEPHSKTGYAWRGYDSDGSPLRIGGETQEEAAAKIRAHHNIESISVEKTKASPYGNTGGTVHEQASTHLLMPPVVRARMIELQRQIDPADLHPEGLEREPHVTVKYGIVPDIGAIRAVCRKFGPITLTFGGLSLFTPPDYDVLKVEVDSPELRRLNEQLAQIPNTDTRPVYHPHLTVAYLQPGMGRKYTGDGPLYGRQVTVDTLTFVDTDDNETAVPLGGDNAVKSYGGWLRGVADDRVSLFSSQVPVTAFPPDGRHGALLPEGLTVFKDADGRYRWVAISSNAYRDRDGEIVSQKALENDVMRADLDGDYGPLRFWHVPGADIGTCDFNAMHGRFLIESGTFNDAEVGQAVSSRVKDYQLSIGFRHPNDNPDHNGVFHFIRRFERSLVPAGRAANPFTSLTVKEPIMQDEKLKAFENLLGPEKAKAILGQAETAEKQADAMGVAFKEAKGDTPLTLAQAEELLNVAIKAYEDAEAAQAAATLKTSEEKKEDDEEEAEDGGMARMYKMMDGLNTKMDAVCKAIEGFGGGRQKDDGGVVADALTAVQEVQTLQGNRLEQAETRVKELTTSLQVALKELQAVQATIGQAPTAVAEGYRPSQSETTVVSGAVAQKEAGGNGFLDWLTQPAGGNGYVPPVPV